MTHWWIDNLTLPDGTVLRKGRETVIVNPFTPEEEWLSVEEFAARDSAAAESLPGTPGLRITKIDMEKREVTMSTDVPPEGK